MLEAFVTRRSVPVAFGAIAFAVVFAANVLRILSIRSLGKHWNVRVVDSTALGVVNSGPYRYVRHPNYVAVFLELLFLPLVQGAWITAALGTVAHVLVLRRRIALEESVLLADPSYAATMGNKPRFIPRLFRRRSWVAGTERSVSDVIVVGGGPAGACLALLLGRRGIEVELLEQSRFPRDKPCGEGLLPGGLDVLHDNGLAQSVGGEPLSGVRYHVARGSVRAGFAGAARGLGQKRLLLDAALSRLPRQRREFERGRALASTLRSSRAVA